MILVADTHTIVWLLEGSRKLSPAARKALENEDAIIIVSTISLAEIRFLYAKHRIAVDILDVLRLIEQSEQFRLWPLDSAVALAMPTSLNIHDAIICGTALVNQDLLGEQVIVVTTDEEIRKSGLVNTVW